MIGLVDCDLISGKKPVLPNLEIMKLYSYYKKQHALPELLITSENITSCQEIYVRKDWNDSFIPHKCSRFDGTKNIGGYAITGGIYRPLDPKIERATPNPNVYIQYFAREKVTFDEINNFKRFQRSTFLRLHGIDHFPIQIVVSGAPVFIYDKILFQDGWQEKIDAILAREPSALCYPHNLTIPSMDIFEEVATRSMFRGSRELGECMIFNFMQTPTEIRKMIRDYGGVLRGYNRHSVGIPLISKKYKGKIHNVDAMMENMINQLNVVFYFHNREITCRAVYDSNTRNPHNEILYWIAKYTQDRRMWHVPMLTYCNTKVKDKDALHRLVNSNKELSRLMSHSLHYIQKGGTWYGKLRYE